MDQIQVERILHNAQFKRLVAKKRQLSWSLTGLMLFIYVGFTLFVGYQPELLHRSFSGGVVTWGIPLGLGIIVLSFVLCAVYSYIANSTYDSMTQQAVAELEAITQSQDGSKGA